MCERTSPDSATGSPNQQPPHPADARRDAPAPGAGSATCRGAAGGKAPLHHVPQPGWVPALPKTDVSPQGPGHSSAFPLHGAQEPTELVWALGQPQPLRSDTSCGSARPHSLTLQAAVSANRPP